MQRNVIRPVYRPVCLFSGGALMFIWCVKPLPLHWAFWRVALFMPPPRPVGEHKERMMDGCEDSCLCWGETLHSAVDNFHTVSSRWLTGTALPVCVIWRLLPYSVSCHSQLCLCPTILIITILRDVAGHQSCFL